MFLNDVSLLMYTIHVCMIILCFVHKVMIWFDGHSMKNRSTIFWFNLYGCFNIHRMFICSCCTYVDIIHLFLRQSVQKLIRNSKWVWSGNTTMTNRRVGSKAPWSLCLCYVMIYVSPTQNKSCLVMSSQRNDHIKTKYDIAHGQPELKKTTSWATVGPAKDKHQVLINPPMKNLGRHRTIKGETIAINHDWVYNQACRHLHNMMNLSTLFYNLWLSWWIMNSIDREKNAF